MSSESNNTNLILLTKITLKPDILDIYKEIVNQTSEALAKTESGLIKNTFIEDNSLDDGYYWEHSFKDSKAVLFHIDNPIWCLYMANHSYLGKSISYEIKGDISKELIEKLESTRVPYQILKSN